jgi:hypothetical protein
MAQRSAVRAAVGTAAALAIALSIASIRRQGEEADAARGAREVIRQQLDAFNRNDFSAAYRHAAPEIREQFPLPQFRRMVTEGYPQIARSRAAEFGEPRFRGDVVAVPVEVTGEDGVTTQALYLMRRVKDRWRVAGVEAGPPGASPPLPQRHKGQEEGRKGKASL